MLPGPVGAHGYPCWGSNARPRRAAALRLQPSIARLPGDLALAALPTSEEKLEMELGEKLLNFKSTKLNNLAWVEQMHLLAPLPAPHLAPA